MATHLDTVNTLRLVGVHIVARARVEASGRFSLRVTPNGFGTPDLGDDPRRVRVSGTALLVESDAMGAPSVSAAAIQGSSLAELAAVAGVDLDEPIDVGRDTPPLGDTSVAIELDAALVARVHAAHAFGAAALDLVTTDMPRTGSPTIVRLWPEHFDVAFDAAARAGVRVNLGVSPGDGFHAEPYAYAGPWTDDRPGDDGFWNAPFGAWRSLADLGDTASAAAFLRAAFDRLGNGPA